MSPLPSTAKRRRERIRRSPLIVATSILCLMSQVHHLIQAFSRPLTVSRNKFPPCLPYVHSQCPISLMRLSSTAVDATESSDSSPPEAPNLQVGNGASSDASVIPVINGAAASSTIGESLSIDDDDDDDDVPHPTANGGFTHTKRSKAKISAANKGKVPWNKGKARSKETRARIAAGVRAKNRERFLEKLKDMGVTEEEYEAKKKEERRRRDAERRARRTANGGYRPTEETKQKISRILKERYARGVKRKPVDPAKVRRGFKHSAETRAKISESLRKRWANDPEYRASQVEKAAQSNGKKDMRQKISETLKKRWEDPEFRARMMESIQNRNRPTNAYGKSRRQRISEAMIAKWKDPEYRKKTHDAMIKKREDTGIVAKPTPKTRKTQKKKKLPVAKIQEVIPRQRAVARKEKTKRAPKKETLVRQVKPKATGETPRRRQKKKVKKEPDGSISRLREERRDLYDLLYADEDDFDGDQSHGIKSAFQLGDENLDEFDPYGLEDF